MCCRSWGHKELDTTSDWTELNTGASWKLVREAPIHLPLEGLGLVDSESSLKFFML